MKRIAPPVHWYRDTYLSSAHWRRVRVIVLQRAKGRCEHCHQTLPLDVHHLHYDSLGGENPATDLIALCRACHAKTHEEIDPQRTGRDEREKEETERMKLMQKRFALHLLRKNEPEGLRFDAWIRASVLPGETGKAALALLIAEGFVVRRERKVGNKQIGFYFLTRAGHKLLNEIEKAVA